MKMHRTIKMGPAAPRRTAGRPVVIAGGTLIDATGNSPIPDAVIILEGERIKAVGRKEEIAIPDKSEVINAENKTVLPGFLDGHGHLEDFIGEIYLHLGITTCPDIQAMRDEYWSLAQRDATNMGIIRGPRVWSAGRAIGAGPDMTATGGGRNHRGTLSWVKTPEQAREVVREKKRLGLDQLKIMDYLPLEAVKAACEEGRRLGMNATGHTYDVCASAEAGMSGVEHFWSVGFTSIADVAERTTLVNDRYGSRIDSEEMPYYYQTENFDRIVDKLIEHNVSWSPTVATWFRPLSPRADRFRKRELSILNKATYLPSVVRAVTLGQYERFKKFPADKLDRIKRGYEKIADFVRRYVKAGGIIRAGSDPSHGMPGMLVHEEMAMLVEAGLSPMEAIQSATINVAKLFGKDKEFGTIEAGKIADLVIIDGDPIKDIWATQNVKMVLLSGNLMDINFHADHTNPIPSPDPWRLIPREIEVIPRSIPQSSKAAAITVKPLSGRVAPWHKVSLAGRLLNTRFVSSTELRATIPAQDLRKGGLKWVNVVSPGESGGASLPAYLIVPFRSA